MDLIIIVGRQLRRGLRIPHTRNNLRPIVGELAGFLKTGLLASQPGLRTKLN